MRRGAHAIVVALSVACAACELPLPVYSPDPIPLEEAGAGGGLLGMGTAADVATPFPMLVDTASPITTYSSGATTVSATRGTVRLYASGAGVSEVPRLQIDNVQIFSTPLDPSGLDTATPVSGVLGGDNLSRFVVGLTYTPNPALNLSDNLILSDCEIGDRCGTVLPFMPAGGHEMIDVGEDVYAYTASYVLLDACVEPSVDPLEDGLACQDAGCVGSCPQTAGADQDACVAKCRAAGAGERRGCDGACDDGSTPDAALASANCAQCIADASRYVSSGLDVRFAVATGFPGIALAASAYDRLRGAGSAAALIASAPHQLFLPGDGTNGAGITVGMGTLGLASTGLHDAAARSSIALVGRTGYFGACDEMARSRRLRRVPSAEPDPADVYCLRWPNRYTYPVEDSTGAWQLVEDPLLKVCGQVNGNGGVCDDRSSDSHTTAYAELEASLPILVLPDTASLLQSINADVRTDSATIEGIIGTELLARFGTTLDFPGNRVVVTCVDPSCRSFPQSNHSSDCSTPDADLFFGGVPARLIGGAGCATK